MAIAASHHMRLLCMCVQHCTQGMHAKDRACTIMCTCLHSCFTNLHWQYPINFSLPLLPSPACPETISILLPLSVSTISVLVISCTLTLLGRLQVHRSNASLMGLVTSCDKQYMCNCRYTDKGRAYNPNAPTLGDTLNTAFIGAVYANIDSTQISSDIAFKLTCFSRSQIRYVLGDAGRSLVSGLGKKPPTHVQVCIPNTPFPFGFAHVLRRQ